MPTPCPATMALSAPDSQLPHRTLPVRLFRTKLRSLHQAAKVSQLHYTLLLHAYAHAEGARQVHLERQQAHLKEDGCGRDALGVGLVPVAQMPAVWQVQPHDAVMRIQQRRVHLQSAGSRFRVWVRDNMHTSTARWNLHHGPDATVLLHQRHVNLRRASLADIEPAPSSHAVTQTSPPRREVHMIPRKSICNWKIAGEPRSSCTFGGTAYAHM